VAAAVDEWDLHPLVVDPVAVSTSGAELATAGGIAAMRNRLLPLADLVTPNLTEAAALAQWPEPSGERDEVERLAFAVLELGAAAVLVTGGHLPGPEASDLLVTRDIFPLAAALAAVRRAFERESEHQLRLATIFNCA
jgi:hydroxymethylpyrimidine/phosphomethylpyrimidine kinase